MRVDILPLDECILAPYPEPMNINPHQPHQPLSTLLFEIAFQQNPLQISDFQRQKDEFKKKMPNRQKKL